MCASCDYQIDLDRIEAHLVQSGYATYAAELITLAKGIAERQHIGDAIHYRLVDIEKAVEGKSIEDDDA